MTFGHSVLQLEKAIPKMSSPLRKADDIIHLKGARREEIIKWSRRVDLFFLMSRNESRLITRPEREAMRF